MKIDDEISCYKIEGKMYPELDHLCNGIITGINKTTNQVRVKDHSNGWEYDVSSEGYEWVGRNFIIFNTYRWDNSAYIIKKIEDGEKEFENRSRKRAIRRGWELKDKEQ